MRDRGQSQQRPRSRPLSEPAIAALSDDADELARAWAQALLAERPLERIGELDLTLLADCGPALCRAVISALASDAALAELLDRSRTVFAGACAAEAIAAAAGSGDGAARIAVVEALRGALWERVGAALAFTEPRTGADAADRLASVCSRLAGSAVAGATPAQAPVPAGREEPAAVRGRALEGRFAPLAEDQPPAAPPFRIVDERGLACEGEPSPGRSASAGARQGPAAAARDLATGAIAVRDQRGERGPGAWIEAIGGALERHQVDHAPFAVLLIEAGERRDGSRAGARPSALSAADERELERHVSAAALRGPSGGLTRERAGRWWLLVPHIDRVAAHALADSLTRELREAFAARGLALEVAVGTACCPQDAREAASLASHADVGLYAARAAARQA
jgi:hypothetical protein